MVDGATSTSGEKVQTKCPANYRKRAVGISELEQQPQPAAIHGGQQMLNVGGISSE